MTVGEFIGVLDSLQDVTICDLSGLELYEGHLTVPRKLEGLPIDVAWVDKDSGKLIVRVEHYDGDCYEDDECR